MNTTVAPVVVDPKPWWMSKIIWLNLISAVLMALELKFDLLQPYLPGSVYAWFAVFLSVANPVLRTITASPITFGFGKRE